MIIRPRAFVARLIDAAINIVSKNENLEVPRQGAVLVVDEMIMKRRDVCCALQGLGGIPSAFASAPSTQFFSCKLCDLYPR